MLPAKPWLRPNSASQDVLLKRPVCQLTKYVCSEIHNSKFTDRLKFKHQHIAACRSDNCKHFLEVV